MQSILNDNCYQESEPFVQTFRTLNTLYWYVQNPIVVHIGI